MQRFAGHFVNNHKYRRKCVRGVVRNLFGYKMSVNMVDYRKLQSVQSHSHLLYRLTWNDLCNSGTGVPRVEVRGIFQLYLQNLLCSYTH